MLADDPPNTEPRPPEPDDVDRPLDQALGWDREFAPEDLAPPVDEGRLRRFVDGQLSEEESTEVSHLVTSFRSWYEALGRVLKERPPSSPDKTKP